ncbi:MAG: two-component system response regulator CreB [Spirochaetia bacterium]|nr:two-component system response regulator CreB [Spirochaetia bacterium]
MKTKTILLIEDERSIADNIVYALNQEGFEVIWAKTGGEGLAMVTENPSLVLLDIGLPDMSGFEVCREIRKKSSLPIIFITARKEEVDQVLGLELGGDDYIEKPFSPRAMVARVRALLRRSGEVKSSSPPGFPFRVLNGEKKIIYFDKPLELSRYEFLILKLLVEKPGWVYARDQIMENVWDEPGQSFDRTIDTHIKTLRGKLDVVRPGVEAVLTHRGMGYSVKADW